MSGFWVFVVTAVVVLLTIVVVAWCWPNRNPKGPSVDEIRQRIEDEEDTEL
ncbi:hypothetical protein [Nocardia aobensis]|uniref:hypothetical protein n=1 Tax=Nocardia aobensis TaxID=257277 RepID=UPI0002DE1D67|nr:hypothetical protein [Nocardia aobensis]